MAMPPPVVTRLYLIRHGESFPNIQPIVGGMRGDAGLTPLGVAQAQALYERLARTGEIQPDVLIASTLPRARQTAEIIAPALGVPIVFDDGVHELRPGEADGMPIGEYKALYGIPDFSTNPYQPLSPGGESWASFTLRVGENLQRITTEHAGKTIVIVCHGGVIDTSFLLFMRMPAQVIPAIEFATHNTSVTLWERHQRTDRTPRWRLVKYNDDTHLQQLGKNEPIDWSAVPMPAERSVGEEERNGHQAVPQPTEN